MTAALQPLPKIIGADIELGNFVCGHDGCGDTCGESAAELLRGIDGLPRSDRHAAHCDCRQCAARRGVSCRGPEVEPVYDPRDRGRRFLPSGHCFYIDLEHLELCLPEVRSAKDLVAAKRAALLVARRALVEANAARPAERRIVVLLNNSDGHGHSYGTHFNFLVTRRCWHRLFARKLHYLLWLAAYQASAAVLFGAGKVGTENGGPWAAFSLSARAEFLEVLVGSQTTAHRPLCNSRDEPLCGGRQRSAAGPEPARSHVICFDHVLADAAVFLVAGVGQIVHAMLEQDRVNPALLLDDPIDALRRWSTDPALLATAELLDGTRVTAVELQRLFLAEARDFAARGNLDGIVPDGPEILEYWDETLRMLAARDLPALSRRLDWALKLRLLAQTMREDRDLTWKSPEMKHLDLIYASLDADEGLFWQLDEAGHTDRLVGAADVARFLAGPPEDTRAWTRGELLRTAGFAVDDVDWDYVRFKTRDRDGAVRHRVVELPDPCGFGRQEMQPVLEDCGTLETLLERLGAVTADVRGPTPAAGLAPRTEER